ncbi:hypothetical protein YC2023_076455 [Brassica napus]
MTGTRLPDECHKQFDLLNPGPQEKLGFPDFPPITEIDGVNFGSHTREYVYRMYHMITSWALTGHWGYDNMRCTGFLVEESEDDVDETEELNPKLEEDEEQRYNDRAKPQLPSSLNSLGKRDLSDENREAAQELKGKAMDSVSEGKFYKEILHLTREISMNPISAILYGNRVCAFEAFLRELVPLVEEVGAKRLLGEILMGTFLFLPLALVLTPSGLGGLLARGGLPNLFFAWTLFASGVSMVVLSLGTGPKRLMAGILAGLCSICSLVPFSAVGPKTFTSLALIIFAFNAVAVATIFRITSSVSPLSSANLILSLLAALSDGSAQLVYWMITSRNSARASIVALSIALGISGGGVGRQVCEFRKEEASVSRWFW